MTDRSQFNTKANLLTQALQEKRDGEAYTHCLDILLALYKDSLEHGQAILQSLSDIGNRYGSK